jgi:hypothetical protein
MTPWIIKKDAADPERAEFLVRVDWDWTVSADQGAWAKHFFSRRVTIAGPHGPTTSHKPCALVGIPSTENRSNQGSPAIVKRGRAYSHAAYRAPVPGDIAILPGGCCIDKHLGRQCSGRVRRVGP